MDMKGPKIANSTLIEKLERALKPGDDAILGLVDSLLDACPREGLGLTWSEGWCHLRVLADSTPLLKLDLPKSVFRTMLARIATLCNEHAENSVSPYGGERAIVSHDSRSYRITFLNTPGEQWLEFTLTILTPSATPSPSASARS
jgi:hypothetical protein